MKDCNSLLRRKSLVGKGAGRAAVALAAFFALTLFLPVRMYSAGVTGSRMTGETVIVDTLNAHMLSSAVSAIEGQVAGVQVRTNDGSPTALEEIIIRGGLGIRGDKMPLIILDGVWLTSSSNQVPNPWESMIDNDYQAPQSLLGCLKLQDIDKIEILKDASATAMYGGNAANGVVIITSKIGTKAGSGLTWNSGVSLGLPPTGTGISSLSSPAVSHRHYLNFVGSENATDVSLSLFTDFDNGVLPGSGNNQIGMKGGLNKTIPGVIDVGLRALFARSVSSIAYASHYLGHSSMTERIPFYGDAAIAETFDSWAEDYDDRMETFRFSPNFYLDWKFLKVMSLAVNAGADYINRNRQRWMGSLLDTGAALHGIAAKSLSMYVRYNADATLAARIPFADGHMFTAALSAGIDGDVRNVNASSGSGFDTEILRANGIAMASSYVRPLYQNSGASTLSYTGSVSYTHGDRIEIRGGIRKFALMGFDDVMNDAPFASVALDFAKMEKYQDALSSAAISTLKVDAGWGKSYNDGVLPYENSKIYFGNDFDAKVALNEELYHKFRLSDINDEINAGLTLGFLNDRIVARAAYYTGAIEEQMRVYDTRKDVSDAVGFSNSAFIRRGGWEFGLCTEPIRADEIRWTLDANVAFNKAVIKDPGKNGTLAFDGFSGPSVGGFSGTPVYVNGFIRNMEPGMFYGKKLANGMNGFIGNPNPDAVFGLNTAVSGFGFKLAMNFTGTYGNDVLNLNGFDKTSELSDAMVEDGSHLRLSNLSLGYDVDMSSVKWIKGLNIALNAHNLFVLSKYSGFDPDVNSFVLPWGLTGIDSGAYPRYKAFTVAVNVKF